MTEYLKIKRDNDFDELPPDDQTIVWRYMDKWKFENLLKLNSIYLCRGDILQDRFEGTYSRDQINEENIWLEDIGYKELIEQERKRRHEDRMRFYINSWCMYNDDLDLMWKAYTKVCHAITIQSRVRRLVEICNSDKTIEYRPIYVSVIKYNRDLIDSPHALGAFNHKDPHFQLDKEIRIIQRTNWDGNDPKQIPEGILLPVNLSDLIERVVLAPCATSKDAENIRDILNKCGLKKIPVESSRYDRELNE